MGSLTSQFSYRQQSLYSMIKTMINKRFGIDCNVFYSCLQCLSFLLV